MLGIRFWCLGNESMVENIFVPKGHFINEFDMAESSELIGFSTYQRLWLQCIHITQAFIANFRRVTSRLLLTWN